VPAWILDASLPSAVSCCIVVLAHTRGWTLSHMHCNIWLLRSAGLLQLRHQGLRLSIAAADNRPGMLNSARLVSSQCHVLDWCTDQLCEPH